LALRAIPDLYGLKRVAAGRSRQRDPEKEAAIKRLEEIGNAVYRVVPPVYESYCKVLPALVELVGEGGERFIGPLRWLPGLGGPPPTAHFRHMTWKALCQECGVEYVKELSGYSFASAFPQGWPMTISWTGGHGELGEADTEALQALLSRSTDAHASVHFYYWLMKTPEFEDRLFEGQLSDLTSIGEATGLGSPSAFWPEDRGWCVVIDYDLDFTLVGGSRELVGELLRSPDLECIEVDATTRVDYRADATNRPRAEGS
jgi:hypothetical protein